MESGNNVTEDVLMNQVKPIQPRLGQDDDGQHDPGQGGHAIVERVRPALRRPRLYRVIMLNDDYTPMNFVVHVLEDIYHMNREQATRVMLKVHTEGRAVCGVFTRDIAETKAEQTNQYARDNEHPLLCQIEPDGGDSDE